MKDRIFRLLTLSALAGALTTASAVNVTLSVNMSVQEAMGQFDPLNDYVTVAGDPLNSWDENATSLFQNSTNADIWEVTVDVAAGAWLNYKFVKHQFGSGTIWELDGQDNRYFQVPATDTNVDTVYFNNVTNVIANHAPVTFQVNMSVQAAQGSFDPGTSTLLLAGGFTAWENNPVTLTQSSSDADIWECTVDITENVGTTLFYKYILDGDWETIDNRSFVMTNEAQTLPVVYFNNVTNTAVPIPVTFSVNMGVAQARGDFAPDSADYVEGRGSFLTDTGSQWIGGFTLSNSVDNPIVYSGTFMTTNAVGGNMLYQFVINGSTWESTGDRAYVFDSTNAVVLPTVFLNDVTALGPITNTPVSAVSADLSWEAGPFVRVQQSTDVAGPWQDIAGTEGAGMVTVPIGPDQTYFRLVGP